MWCVGCDYLGFVYCLWVGDVFDDQFQCGVQQWYQQCIQDVVGLFFVYGQCYYVDVFGELYYCVEYGVIGFGCVYDFGGVEFLDFVGEVQCQEFFGVFGFFYELVGQ